MMIPTGPVISKSKFLSGLQCPLLLWSQYNDRDAVPPPPPATQYVFDMGHTVGDLAKQLYPGGIEVGAEGRATAPRTGGPARGPASAEGRPDLEATVAATGELLRERRPLFEASFLGAEATGRRYVRVDILAPTPGDEESWDLVEVKSSTRVKDINLWDVAFQAGALESAGVKLSRLYLMHIDTSYVRRGPVEPARLFARDDVTDRARKLMSDVPTLFARFAATIGGDRPQVPIGPQCRDPFHCAMLPVCWRDVAPDDVTTLVRAGRQAFEWRDRGWLRIGQVPDAELSDLQLAQKAAVTSGAPRVDGAAVRDLLARLEYPVWHLDFESLNPAVPLFDGTRPFEQVPFQFSLHVQEAPGAAPRHVEFLSTTADDPRPAFLEALRAIGPRGTVLAFNASFESQVLAQLGRAWPAYGAMCADLGARLRDLADPFRTFAVYHPAQHGSYSLKAVLPAWTGRGYEDLAIADGQAAGRGWHRAVYATDLAPGERERILSDLRAYCGRDTGAMVELLEVLRGLA
jgi:hypothetical protein